MRLICAGLTDVGRTRDHNEDNFYLSEEEALCIVADGMGGHRSGEVASSMAVKAITTFYQQTKEPNSKIQWPYKQKIPEHREEKRLIASIQYANQLIYNASLENDAYAGMGTTIVGAYFFKDGLFLAHVGDSRAYRLRQNLKHPDQWTFEQLTADHSLASEYIRLGILDKKDLSKFPYKNVITRAVGLAETLEVESHFLTHQPNDIYLLCSDGLTDPVSDQSIMDILLQHMHDLEDACRALITEANRQGGPDNVTVVLAQIRP